MCGMLKGDCTIHQSTDNRPHKNNKMKDFMPSLHKEHKLNA
jgi:hypothetical protein